MAGSASSTSELASGPVSKAISSLMGHALCALAAVIAAGAILIIAATTGYVLNSWIGCFFAIGGALVVLAITCYIFGLRVTEPRASATQTSESASDEAPSADDRTQYAPAAAPDPDADQRSESSEDAGITKPSQLLPIAALLLGTASVLGPRRMLRIGIRLYTMWSTTRALIDSSGPRR